MRRWRGPFLPATLLLGLTACATMRPQADPDIVTDRLAAGAAFLERQAFDRAYDNLSWVYVHCPDTRPGRDALLLLVTSEIDPRNPVRRLDVGATLAAHYLSLPDIPADRRPVAESLYLLATELGGEAGPVEPPPAPAPGRTEGELPATCVPTAPAAMIPLPSRLDDGDAPDAGTVDTIPPAPARTILGAETAAAPGDTLRAVPDTTPATPDTTPATPDTVRATADTVRAAPGAPVRAVADPAAPAADTSPAPDTTVTATSPEVPPALLGAGWLPVLPIPTVPERIAAVAAERDSLAAELASARARIRELQQQVGRQQDELDRIRKTLRP